MLLADDLLDALVDPEAERQQRVDPRAELADVAGPEQQRCDGISASAGSSRSVVKKRWDRRMPRRIAGATPGGDGAARDRRDRHRDADRVAHVRVATGHAPRPDGRCRPRLDGVTSLLVVVVVLAVVFDYINGFHDTANAIATSVATRALRPRYAILMATAFNFIGAFAGTAVAKTIGAGLVDEQTTTQAVVAAALIGAIAWNLITW